MLGLIKLAGKKRFKLFIACSLHVIASALAVVPFLLIYLIFIEIFSGSCNHRRIWMLMALIPLIYFAMSAILVSAYNVSHAAAYEILADTRIDLGRKFFNLPMGYFNEKNTGELETVMNENVEILELFLAHHLPEMISTVFVPLSLALILFLMDWRMAMASILPVTLAMAVIMTKDQKWKDMIDAYLRAQAEINSTILEYVKGIKVIKAFNQTPNSFRRYRNTMTRWRESMIEWSRERALPFTIYQALITSTPAFIIPPGLLLYNLGIISKDTFLMFLIVGPVFGSLFMRIYEFLRYGVEEKECVNRIRKLLDADEMIDNGNENVEYFDITFRNVYFAYETGNTVLKNISFHVPNGTRCAIVGPSGAGKTTIARLICRFWDVDDGEILVGGCNIKDMSVKDLLSYVSVVLQEPYLFNDTILENIKMGNPDASVDDVIVASKVAGCHKFIEKLPNGYLTRVGESGVKLSGGEKQRISIARALLKDAPIVVIDEATAFLDPENEAIIQEAVSKLTSNKTVIVITHKLHTIREVENILVIKEGKIVEKGHFDELIAKDGLFSEMWHDYMSSRNWSIKNGEINVQ